MNIPDLRQKAESGNVAAESILGICYLDGVEMQVDYALALRFLSAAAAKGASRAMVGLARMHAEGLGIPKDLAQSLRLYRAAAERGEFVAQIELGRIFSRGLGTAVAPEEAFRWYSAAAVQEDRVQDGDDIQEAKAYVAAHSRF
jgi:TPR repeat protein